MASSDPENPDKHGADDRLGSWKAIATYLKRDITTVQRWERREGMPVHRHVHDKRGSVYAFRTELDAWLTDRRIPTAESEPLPAPRRSWIIPAAVAGAVLAATLAWALMQRDSNPTNPLADARISPLTDFDGLELGAAMSPDGKFVAFLSDRDGPVDVWVTQIGSGEFLNLTKGGAPELMNPEVRSLAFTPDGSLVTMWTRRTDGVVNVMAVPTIGGALREYRAGVVEMDWANDARRLVFHTTEPGDPTYVLESEQSTPRQIYVAPKGGHNHFPTWSPDDGHIYFVRGFPPDQTDIWRITPEGAGPERMTTHNSRVLYPSFLDDRTLLYLATSEDGSGPWVYMLDVDTRRSRRISFGVEQYTSLAASADRTRWVATVEHSKASVWRVPIKDTPAIESDASRVTVPTVGAFSPRLGVDEMIYVSAKDDGHAIWKLANGVAIELWSAPQTRVVGGAAISPDRKWLAFSAERAGGTKLHLMDIGTASTRVLSEQLDVRGPPTWSHDSKSVIVGVVTDRDPQLYRVPLDGEVPSPLVQEYSINPLLSPDGRFILYADVDAGPDSVLKAVSADGAPYPLPEIKLPRGARRVAFAPGANALIVLQGEMRHSNFWRIDLDTGARTQLTNFGREFTVRDFDVSADGDHIVFDRRQANSDLAIVEMKKIPRLFGQ